MSKAPAFAGARRSGGLNFGPGPVEPGAERGKLALNGGKPYVDFFEMKPPVMFYSYAFLIGIFGYSATGVHLAATALAALNTFFTFEFVAIGFCEARDSMFGCRIGRRHASAEKTEHRTDVDDFPTSLRNHSFRGLVAHLERRGHVD